MSVGVEVSCWVLEAGGGLMTGGCGGTVLSGGAALQPSGSARRAGWEGTKDNPAPLLSVLSSGLLNAPMAGPVIRACVAG